MDPNIRIDGYKDAEWVLVSRFIEDARKEIRAEGARAPRRFEDFFNNIADNILKPKFSITSAKAVGKLSGNYSAKFFQLTGMRPKEYVDHKKADLARRILQHVEAFVADVAMTVGFEDPSSFARWYHRLWGHSPSEEVKIGCKALDPRVSANTAETGVASSDQTSLERFWRNVKGFGREQIKNYTHRYFDSINLHHFHFLLEKAKHEGRLDRARGEELTLAALDTLRLVEYRNGVDYPDETAVGYAHLANACRLLFKLSESAAWFAEADRFLPRDRPQKPLLYCQVHFPRVSLLWWQGETEAALSLWHDLIPDIRSYGSQQLLARALILGGDIYDAFGHPNRALPLLIEALELTEFVDDSYVTFTAHFNLTHLFAMSGMGVAAAEQFKKVLDLHKYIEVTISAGLMAYLGALVAMANGDFNRAKTLFLEARGTFMRSDLDLYAAVVSLYLALLCLEAGSPDEALELSIGVIPSVSRFSTHREAIAAVAILQEASKARAISESSVRAALHHLETVRKDPTSNFLSKV